MKIVYKEPWSLRLAKVTHEARVEGKKIEKIVLTKKEWNEFIEDFRKQVVGCSLLFFKQGKCIYMGVDIEEEKDE